MSGSNLDDQSATSPSAEVAAALPPTVQESSTAISDRRSYQRGATSPALLDETIGRNLRRTATNHPDVDALVDIASGRRWSYAQFCKHVDRLACGLLALGITRGDRIGIWSPNTPEWTFVQYAAAQIGAILVTINPAYRTDELAYALRQSAIRTVIAARSHKSSDYVTMLRAVQPECPSVRDLIFVGDSAWNDLISHDACQATLDQIAATLRPDDPIVVQYTSGTTGLPKGATLTHRNILNNGYFVGEGLGYTERDRVCIPVPFYHCFGMVMGNLACTSHGATMVIPSQAFDPTATLQAVAAEQCTSLYGVPTMFIAELALDTLGEFDLSSLRTGIMAGSPCPEAVMGQVIEKMNMAEVAICYGMTETSPVSTQTSPDDPIELRVGSVGQVGPHLEVRIVEPGTAEVVARGRTGELCTRGYSVMSGYWAEPDHTTEVIDADGWMHTGDVATMDNQGYIRITGRIKDMVIRGGENIYPREIEEFLHGHPDILDAQIVGVPDEKYGEELMAWLRVQPGAPTPTPESIRAFCAGRIAHYKVPRYIQVIDDYPMTVTGKVRKIELRTYGVELIQPAAPAALNDTAADPTQRRPGRG